MANTTIELTDNNFENYIFGAKIQFKYLLNKGTERIKVAEEDTKQDDDHQNNYHCQDNIKSGPVLHFWSTATRIYIRNGRSIDPKKIHICLPISHTPFDQWGGRQVVEVKKGSASPKEHL